MVIVMHNNFPICDIVLNVHWEIPLLFVSIVIVDWASVQFGVH